MYSTPSSHPSPMLHHHHMVSYADVTNKHSLLQWSHKLLQKVVPLILESHLFHVDVTCWHCFISPLDTVILAGKPHKLVLNLETSKETSVLYPHYNQSTQVQASFPPKPNFITEFRQMLAQKRSDTSHWSLENNRMMNGRGNLKSWNAWNTRLK